MNKLCISILYAFLCSSLIFSESMIFNESIENGTRRTIFITGFINVDEQEDINLAIPKSLVNRETDRSKGEVLDTIVTKQLTLGKSDEFISFIIATETQTNESANELSFSTWGDAGITIVRFSKVNSDKSLDVEISLAKQRSHYFEIGLSTIFEKLELLNDDVVKVEFISSETEALEALFFRSYDFFVPYNIAGKEIVGLHIPIGYFGIFQENNSTLISAQPINLAIGAKFYPNTDFYFGLRALLFWQIYPELDQGTSVSAVNNFGVGGSIDVNGFFDIGLGYSVLSPDNKEGKCLLMIRFGTELMELIQ